MAEVFEAVAERDDGTSERVAIKRVLREPYWAGRDRRIA